MCRLDLQPKVDKEDYKAKSYFESERADHRENKGRNEERDTDGVHGEEQEISADWMCFQPV